jgi:hypothetical protein
MKFGNIAILGLMSVCWQLGAAADHREIILNDGSVISGEIMSSDGNRYTIKSSSLGTVEIDSSEISVIQAPSSKDNASQVPRISSAELSSMQEKLAKNPDIMRLIESVQHDPQVQAILQDPQLMQSLMAGDTQALINSPQFNALMNNPAIRQIEEKALLQ